MKKRISLFARIVGCLLIAVTVVLCIPVKTNAASVYFGVGDTAVLCKEITNGVACEIELDPTTDMVNVFSSENLTVTVPFTRNGNIIQIAAEYVTGNLYVMCNKSIRNVRSLSDPGTTTSSQTTTTSVTSSSVTSATSTSSTSSTTSLTPTSATVTTSFITQMGQYSIKMEGIYIFGETLRAIPSDNLGVVTYQWYRSNSNGTVTAIPFETNATYRLNAADIDNIVYVEVKNGSTTIVSSGETVRRQPASRTPMLFDLVVSNVSSHGAKDGTIASVNSSMPVEYYDKVQNRWKSTTGVKLAVGDYQVRFAETSVTQASGAIFIKIMEPPVADDLTIINNTVTGGKTGQIVPKSTIQQTMEYSINGSPWTSFSVNNPATGLSAGTYLVRYAQSDNSIASLETEIFVMEPNDKKVSLEQLSITHNTTVGGSTGKLLRATGVTDAIEALVNDKWVALPVSGLSTGIYDVRLAQTNTTFAGESIKVRIKEPGAKPADYSIKDVSTYAGRDGALLGTKNFWQYSLDSITWNDCSDSGVTNLSAGYVYLRTKETDTNTVSPFISVYIRQPEATPKITVNYINEQLENGAGKEVYLINNVEFSSSSTGTLSLIEDWIGTSIKIIKKGNGTTTTDSAAQVLAINKRPAAPTEVKVQARTDKQVVIETERNQEYSLDGKTWYTGTADGIYTFKNLTSGKDYTIYARVKAIVDVSFGSSVIEKTTTTKKSSVYAQTPGNIVIQAITSDSITIHVIAGQEYHIDGNWVKPTTSTYTWNGLRTKASYTITTRTAETNDTMPSSTVTTRVTTYQKLSFGTYSLDYVKGGMTGLSAGKYVVDGKWEQTVGTNGLLDLTMFYGRTVSVVRKGSANDLTADSDAVIIRLSSPVAAPNSSVVPTENIFTELSSITISQSDKRLEYRILDENKEFVSTEYKIGTGGDIVFRNLKPNVQYYIWVSYVGTATTAKSNGCEIPVRMMVYEKTPTASVNTLKNQLTGLEALCSYKINGQLYQSSSYGTIYVNDNWIGHTVEIVKAGDGVTTADSLTQNLKLPGYSMMSEDITVVSVTFYGAKNGAIYGLNNQMEYSANGGTTWTPIVGSYLEQLPLGQYLIRKAAVDNVSFASVPVICTIDTNVAVADAIEKLNRTVTDDLASRKASGRYSDEQIAELQSIVDAGLKDVYDNLNAVAEVEQAGERIRKKVESVICVNIPTADGKLTGDHITDNLSLQYPNNSDEIWGNIRSEAGFAQNIVLCIEKMGKTTTSELADLVKNAIQQKKVLPYGSITAAEIQDALRNVELKIGLDISLKANDVAITEFHGPYTITVLLPKELQGLEELNVIAMDSQDNVELHPAKVRGNYLVFETDHFSIYGIIATDKLQEAKETALKQIDNYYNSLNRKDYTDSSWEAIQQIVDMSMTNVTNSSSEESVNRSMQAFIESMSVVKPQARLGWLWLTLVIVAILVGLVVAALLVWRVHYFNNNKSVKSEFCLFNQPVFLLKCSKKGFVLEGWYFEPELINRAEDGFPMPWNGVKLYAKWVPEKTSDTQDTNILADKGPTMMLNEPDADPKVSESDDNQEVSTDK